MEMIDRYLDAVRKQLLPARTPQTEILAELSANLHAEMDDRAEELGRPLTEEEQAAVIKRHGHPMQVAAQYLPTQHLIGPLLFPIYLFTLRRALPLVLLVFGVITMTTAIFNHSASNGVAQIIGALFQIPNVFFVSWAWITLAFAIAEWAITTHSHSALPFTRWDPRKLPEPESAIRAHILPKHPWVDVVVDAVVLTWLILVPSFPAVLIFGPSAKWFTVEMAPVWHGLYLPIVTLLSIRFALKIIALGSRRMRGLTEAFWIASEVCIVAVLAVLLRSGHSLFLFGSQLQPQVQSGIELGVTIALRIGIIAALCSIAWKLFKVLQPDTKLPSCNLA